MIFIPACLRLLFHLQSPVYAFSDRQSIAFPLASVHIHFDVPGSQENWIRTVVWHPASSEEGQYGIFSRNVARLTKISVKLHRCTGVLKKTLRTISNMHREPCMDHCVNRTTQCRVRSLARFTFRFLGFLRSAVRTVYRDVRLSLSSGLLLGCSTRC